MKTLKNYLKKAKKEGWAIPQFNFSDFTQMKAILEMAQKLKSPVILGTSEGESNFFGLDEAIALRDTFRNKGHEGTSFPIFLNLDHGKSFEYIKKAIDAGYDMVHFDGSELPLEENIKITKRVKSYAKWRGVLVEGEVGVIGGDLTDPDQAKKYFNRTKVDLLAVSIGNLHGVRDSSKEPKININLLEKIKKIINKNIFVLHGGSGTSDQDIKRSINLGVVKININTELRKAFANDLRDTLQGSDEIVPYKFLLGAKQAVEMVVEKKIKLFDSFNKI